MSMKEFKFFGFGLFIFGAAGMVCCGTFLAPFPSVKSTVGELAHWFAALPLLAVLALAFFAVGCKIGMDIFIYCFNEETRRSVRWPSSGWGIR
jgi:hypothetical protein